MTPSGEVTFCLKRVFQGEGLRLQPQIITDVHSRCSAKGTKNIQVAMVSKYFCPFLVLETNCAVPNTWRKNRA